jgi:hypothetical protein
MFRWKLIISRDINKHSNNTMSLPNLTKLRSDLCEELRKKSLLCQTSGSSRLSQEERKDRCSDEIEKYKDCLKGSFDDEIQRFNANKNSQK